MPRTGPPSCGWPTTYDPEDANDGITTLWWDTGLVTFTFPAHQIGGPPVYLQGEQP